MTSDTPQPTPEGRNDLVKTITRYLGNEIRRITFQRSTARRSCGHPTGDRDRPPTVLACPACVRDSSTWVQLRMCQTCGSVGCCDTSVGRHAAGHFEATGHPVMRSIEPSDTWGWCYVDEAYLALGSSA
jgi:uncharacterized UBP type Zn finger protein